MLPTFTQFYKTIKVVEKALDNNDGTIENFFEIIENENLNVEDVMTSDIATMTVPLCSLRRRLGEAAPKSKKAEDFIMKNKQSFKRRYGEENYLRILYATAHKLFPDN